VISHPDDKSKYLVHGCLEGPEAGIYYRGKGEITNGNSTIIQLPAYVKNLGYDFTVQITPIYNGKSLQIFNVSEVEDNMFTVYGDNGKFYWIVHASRMNIKVEPSRSEVEIKGVGPYIWI
jgi:hypothetical protein